MMNQSHEGWGLSAQTSGNKNRLEGGLDGPPSHVLELLRKQDKHTNKGNTMQITIIAENDNVVTEALVTGWARSPQSAYDRANTAIYRMEQRDGKVVAVDTAQIIKNEDGVYTIQYI